MHMAPLPLPAVQPAPRTRRPRRPGLTATSCRSARPTVLAPPTRACCSRPPCPCGLQPRGGLTQHRDAATPGHPKGTWLAHALGRARG